MEQDYDISDLDPNNIAYDGPLDQTIFVPRVEQPNHIPTPPPVASTSQPYPTTQRIMKIKKKRDEGLQLLETIWMSSGSWNIPDIRKEELIILNSNEFALIKEYRKSITLQNQQLTKSFVDNIIINQNKIFDNRNEGKIPIPPVIPLVDPTTLKRKGKGFFSRK
jgi:hypothetical protein